MKNSGCQRLWERENGEFAFNGDRVLVGEDKKVLEMDDVDGWTTMSILNVTDCAFKNCQNDEFLMSLTTIKGIEVVITRGIINLLDFLAFILYYGLIFILIYMWVGHQIFSWA